VKSCEIRIMCPLPRPLRAQSTTSLSRGWTWMEHAKKIPQ
jgi:hypothetical protein